MSQRLQIESRGKTPSMNRRRLRSLWALLILLLLVGGAAAFWVAQRRPIPEPRYKARPRGTVTFNKAIAPIVFAQCAGCHRPGEAGPFNLLTYADVKKRASEIAEVTKSRFMPPWLPEDGHEEILDQRRLTAEQIGLIAQWVDGGAPEGNASDLPSLPNWTEGWQLGPPDLVVTMPDTYTLPAEGKDIYRNFIIPVPTTTDRFVRAVELRPSSKTVHHAFIRIDPGHESRRIDARDPEPGFGGMNAPLGAETPAGQFLGWQPGRGPSRAPEGLAWTLPAAADVVLLMHMQPGGKPEPIRPSIGFYFTNTPATNRALRMAILSYDIHIPAGATDYTREGTMTLPVDTYVLAVLPHAHYLGKRLEGFAVLPGGERKTLLVIPQWDFNWQSDFRFARAVFLPKDTTLHMHYTYDNSTNNLRNPHDPPVPVKYGLQTGDEMAELHFQLLAHNPGDQQKLAAAANNQALTSIGELSRHKLRQNPLDVGSIVDLAKVLYLQRRLAPAEGLLRRAVALPPESADAQYSLGNVLMEQSNFPQAEQAFLAAFRLDPGDYKACNNAGRACLRQGKLDEAATLFQEALRLHPGDSVAQSNLDLVLRAKRGDDK